MKKYDASDIKPFFQKHQWLARITGLLMLLTFPIFFVLDAMLVHWDEGKEDAEELWDMVFKPWRL